MFPVEGYVMDLFFPTLCREKLKVHPSLDPQVSAISRIQQLSNSAEKSCCESLRIRGPRLEMITQHADVNRWKPQDV